MRPLAQLSMNKLRDHGHGLDLCSNSIRACMACSLTRRSCSNAPLEMGSGDSREKKGLGMWLRGQAGRCASGCVCGLPALHVEQLLAPAFLLSPPLAGVKKGLCVHSFFSHQMSGSSTDVALFTGAQSAHRAVGRPSCLGGSPHSFLTSDQA